VAFDTIKQYCLYRILNTINHIKRAKMGRKKSKKRGMGEKVTNDTE
jgi:hypothetical protein